MRPDDPDFNDDGIISLYIGAFAARHDLYVVNGAGVVRERLTPDVVREAILHRYPISGYMAAADGRTQVGAIDFDTTDGRTSAFTVQDFLDDHDIPAMVAESRRGAHLWITSWDWVGAGDMARCIRAAVSLALSAEAAADPKVEIFPKPGEDLAVGALRLPGLHHQKDQEVRPIHFLAKSGTRSYPDPTFRTIIEGHDLTTPEAVRRLAGKAPKSNHWPKDLGQYSLPRRDFGPEPSASEVLASWGVHIRPGGTGRCPRHDDKHGSLTVFRDDRRVYCGAPHCPLNGDGHGIGSVMLARMAAPG